MTQNHVNVNVIAGRFVSWIDKHPRTGWYTAIIVTLDLLLQLAQLFH